MIAPLSNYRHITPLMSLLNMALVAALTVLGSYEPAVLWVNWAVAGLLSWGIRHIVARLRLEGSSDIRAFALSWPTLTIGFNFSYCHLSHELFYPYLVQAVAFLCLILVTVSLWKVERSIVPNILSGLIIGAASTINPHILMWVLFIPLWCRLMRCNTLRNMLGAFTGVLLGIWVLYCGFFFVAGSEAADAMLMRYAVLKPVYTFPYSTFALWQWLFLLFATATSIAYAVASLVSQVGHTVRISTTVSYFGLLSLLVMALYFIDVEHPYPYVMMFAVLLGLQFTTRQSIARSPIHEWLMLFLIALGAALCIVEPVLTFFALA